MKALNLLIILVALFSLTVIAQAEVPRFINYQGKLTTAEGGCVDTTLSMQFSIYSDSTDGDPLWSETQSSVRVSYGVFNVLLGSETEIPDSVFTGDIRYLGVKVEEDQEMVPRKQIASVGYAYRSLNADTARFAHCLDKGPVTFEEADNCDSLNRARIAILTPPEGYTSVKLYLFAESSLMYDKATFADTLIGDLPDEIDVWREVERTGPPYPGGYNCGSGAPSCDPSPSHTHSIKGIYIHSHEIRVTRSHISRSGGSLPSDVSCWIDNADVTSSLSWNTQNPTVDKETMLDGEEILGWVSSPGVHWIEIGTEQAGRVRFLIYAR